MAETTTTPPAPETTAAAAAEVADPILEIVLDGMKEPVKVPVSKIPVDKLNPHLAKLRSEADRRMSEADKRTKELDARAAKYDSVEKLADAVQKDPRLLKQLASELGVTKEALRKLSEEEVAEAIREQMRADDEKADPAKKEAREEREERERLRKEVEDLRKEREQHQKAGLKAQSERFIINALETGKFAGTLKLEAAREMVPILRAAIEGSKEDLSDFSLTPEDLAKKAKEALRKRAQFVYDEDAEVELTPKQIERAKVILAKQGQAPRPHPAVGQGGKGKGTGPRNGKASTPAASDFLLKLLKTPQQ